MKEILGIKLENYRVPTVREYLHSVNDKVEACATVKTLMPMVYPAWKAAFERMVEVYEISLKSEDTALIHNLDDRRDNLMTAVKASANSFRKAMDDDTRVKGTAVWDAIGSFRVDIEAQYNIQTAQLDSLLGVLLGEQLRPSVEALGMLPLVTELKSLNDRFHELVGNRDIENIGKPDGQRQEAVANAIAAYRRLVKFVNAYYLINVEAAGTEDAGLALFIDAVNSIILRYRRTYHVSGGSGSEETEDGEDSTPSEGEGGEGGETTEPTWPEIDPDSEREFTATFLNSEDMEEIEIIRGRYGTPLTPPQAPEGTIWPRNLPETMPYGDFVTRNIPADSPTEPLYKLEYKDGDEVLRTDMLPVNSIIIRYPLPDDKIWTHFPHRGLTPAQDWAVVAGEE